MPPGFVHLHVHSEYSLTDSTIRVGDLVTACAQADMPAVALTDQSNLFALVKFYKDAEKAGLKPIAGADLWIANPADRNKPTRLTLLCRNRAGYLNLSRLLSRAYIEGQHGDYAQVDAAWLQGGSDGLIALLGRDSDLGHLLLSGNAELAAARCRQWLDLFGDGLYLEICRIGQPQEGAFNDAALFMVAGAGLTAAFFYWAMKPAALVPGRAQVVAETGYNFIHGMVKDAAGEEGVKKFFPFVFTLFLWIFAANMLGMFPYFFTPTSQIVITATMAPLRSSMSKVFQSAWPWPASVASTDARR